VIKIIVIVLIIV